MTVQTLPNTEAAIDAVPPEEGRAVIDYWRDAGHEQWFAKDPGFDVEFRDRFAAAYS